MLKTRLIPAVLLSRGRAVKGCEFKDFRDVGHPAHVARIYDAQGADELAVFGITTAEEGSGPLHDAVARIADECFMPITAGGGVRTLQDFGALLRSGADKISVNTSAVEHPDLIQRAADRFGSQCVVVSIDARRRGPGHYEVFTGCGTRATGLDVLAWVDEAVARGAGELFLTSIDREGRREGFDLELVKSVAERVPVPVVAHGGAGTLEHLVGAIKEGLASAVAAGTIFHFTDQSVIKARAYMRGAGLNVRLG